MSENFSPNGFDDPSARVMAQAVDRGDVARALAAARTVAGGVNAHGQNGETALLLATDRFDVPMVAALLQAGADPNGAPDTAPLHQAVKGYDMAVTKLLLKAGANPDGTMGGEPALYEAALLGATEPAKLLLEAGAQVNLQDEVGNTAALVAAAAEHWTMVAFLLDHGATIWSTDTGGVTIGGLADRSRLRRDSPEGQALNVVIERLKKAGFPYPPPKASEIRMLVAEKKWPPLSGKPR